MNLKKIILGGLICLMSSNAIADDNKIDLNCRGTQIIKANLLFGFYLKRNFQNNMKSENIAPVIIYNNNCYINGIANQLLSSNIINIFLKDMTCKVNNNYVRFYLDGYVVDNKYNGIKGEFIAINKSFEKEKKAVRQIVPFEPIIVVEKKDNVTIVIKSMERIK